MNERVHCKRRSSVDESEERLFVAAMPLRRTWSSFGLQTSHNSHFTNFNNENLAEHDQYNFQTSFNRLVHIREHVVPLACCFLLRKKKLRPTGMFPTGQRKGNG